MTTVARRQHHKLYHILVAHAQRQQSRTGYYGLTLHHSQWQPPKDANYSGDGDCCNGQTHAKLKQQTLPSGKPCCGVHREHRAKRCRQENLRVPDQRK
jgi:hypothetical protein